MMKTLSVAIRAVTLTRARLHHAERLHDFIALVPYSHDAYVAGALRGKIVRRFDKMSKLDVCFYVFPSLLDRVLGHLPFVMGFGEALFYAFPHRLGNLLSQCVDVAVSQGTVRGSDRGIHHPGRLDSGEAFAFAGAVNPHHRLEEVSISDAFRSFA
jgi:hypothetical protein